MAVEQLQQSQPQGEAARERGTSFPGFSLASCIVAIKELMTHGGQATPDHFASYLGYKGTNNGAYLTRTASCRQFNLLGKSGAMLVPTPLAQRVLHPVYPQDVQAALVEAFLSCELFKRIYEDFKGKELPPEFGMKNALRNIYAVKPDRVKDCYRVLMESAETAGFFTTRAGARTHLIMPMLQAPAAALQPAVQDLALGGGGGDGGDGGNGGSPYPTAATHAPTVLFADQRQPVSAKDSYLSALIRVFEKKAADGEIDEALMQRIERLLGGETK